MSRAENGLVAIAIPDGLGGVARLFMDPLGGTDQIVAIAGSSSWTAFERPLPALFHASVGRNPGLVVDVGANTGFYALLAAYASPAVRVLAFEPYGAVFGALTQNIAANFGAGRIEPVALALSDRAGPALLYIPVQDHGLMETSSSLEAGFKPSHSAALPVETVTLDDFLATHPQGAQRVAVIKIDVEGHEAAVVAGARRTIRRSRPLLFVEILPGADTNGLNLLLREEHYTDVPLRPDAAFRPEAELRFHAEAWNHALVPAEGLAEFLQTPSF